MHIGFDNSNACTQQKPAEFFVSPDGNDANSGTEAASLQTLEKSKESVRSQLCEMPGESVEFNINGGVYYLEESVVFLLKIREQKMYKWFIKLPKVKKTFLQATGK